MSDQHEELVELFVSSLTDQLVILYSDGPSEGTNDKFIERGLLALLAKNETSKEEELVMQDAIPLAIQRWKDTTPVSVPKKSKSTPISLFDQLTGGGFQPPVTIDDIKEAQSAEDRLTVFRSVSYVDDLLLDWNEIKSMLLSDLRGSLQANAAVDIIKIHRKYYDLGRASSEYLLLQYGICHNIFDAIMSYTQQDNSNAELLLLLIRTWCDILVDLIQRDVFVEELVGTMESRMLELLLDDSKYHIATSTESIQFSTAHVLALADTRARWFQGWVRSTSVGSLLTLLEKTSILPTVISRCCLDSTETESDNNSRAMQKVLRDQSLVILASIMEKTRVSCFPWHLASSIFVDIEQSTEDGPARTTAHIGKIIEIFLQTMAMEESTTSLQVCCNALEDVLSGCRAASDYAELISKLNERVSAMSVKVRNKWEKPNLRLQH
ncbi:unnamed protein product [Cylindrotheca closterium]|uniref:Uncharacterized protein n=1 Tax=Cylindrotheca closterium TaxID=2856 RepID=A0AAD2CQS6_9STRA|nr:unnamed protein product [Cylindrotheca closterium]